MNILMNFDLYIKCLWLWTIIYLMLEKLKGFTSAGVGNSEEIYLIIEVKNGFIYD